MKRKVVKHGSATLTVSLPSRWVKKYGIKAGDELEIVEDKGNLIIVTSHDIKSVKEANLDMEKFGLLGGRAIGALFKGGVDLIRINYKNPSSISEIEKSLNELIGFEIMQQTENCCTIKEVSGFSDQSELVPMIKRTFMLLMSVIEDCLGSIKSNNKELLENIIHRDTTINKFANYCRRLINKKGLNKIKDVPLVYYIIEEVENLGDEYKYLAKFILENNIKVTNKEIFKILEKQNNFIRQFFSLYAKFSSQKAKELAEEKKALMEWIDKAMRTAKNPEEIRILGFISKMAVIVNNMIGPLMTMKVPELCENKI